MMFECHMTVHLSYRTLLDAPTQAHAEQRMRVLVADAELKPETTETQVEAYAELYCEDCGEEHYGPVCKKPPSSALIAPSWEREAL
jgi:hypothetical protein